MTKNPFFSKHMENMMIILWSWYESWGKKVIRPWSCQKSWQQCEEAWQSWRQHGMIMTMFLKDHGMIMVRWWHGSHVFPTREEFGEIDLIVGVRTYWVRFVMVKWFNLNISLFFVHVYNMERTSFSRRARFFSLLANCMIPPKYEKCTAGFWI